MAGAEGRAAFEDGHAARSQEHIPRRKPSHPARSPLKHVDASSGMRAMPAAGAAVAVLGAGWALTKLLRRRLQGPKDPSSSPGGVLLMFQQPPAGRAYNQRRCLIVHLCMSCGCRLATNNVATSGSHQASSADMFEPKRPRTGASALKADARPPCKHVALFSFATLCTRQARTRQLHLPSSQSRSQSRGEGVRSCSARQQLASNQRLHGPPLAPGPYAVQLPTCALLAADQPIVNMVVCAWSVHLTGPSHASLALSSPMRRSLQIPHPYLASYHSCPSCMVQVPGYGAAESTISSRPGAKGATTRHCAVARPRPTI